MNRTAFKFAASTMIVSLTMVTATAQSVAMRRGSPERADSQTDLQAAQLHEQAGRAMQQGQIPQALGLMENAVALSPRDAGYRLLLADLYMKSGRFDAARTTFADVVELDPSNVRAGLSLALMNVAVGRPQAAVAQLDELSGRASAADLGLAYALAGMPERAIEILEPAARAFDATPRLRQNLALSYALAGDWTRARTIAAQDISPIDLAPRLQQWAALARPDGRSTQVAALLGVSPVQDPGQPVRLALSPAGDSPEAGVAFADAAPAAGGVSNWGQAADGQPPVQLVEAAPAEAEAGSYYLPASTAQAPASEQEAEFAAAAEGLNRPNAAIVRTASATLPAPVFQRETPVSPDVRRGNSRFVVQLGAFSNEGNAERAWQQAERQYNLGDRVPLTTTIAINGRTLHRVSVAGFASQSDAARLCSALRSQGGACFVRANAGDASIRWAARYAQGRNRDV